MASEAQHNLAAPTYTTATDLNIKTGTMVHETPLNDVNLEKSALTDINSVPSRSLTALARPRKGPKPRPFDRFVTACGEQSILVKGFLIAFVTAIPFLIFLLVAYTAFDRGYLIGPKQLQTTIRRLARWLLLCWGSFIGLLYLGRIVAMGVSSLCSLSSQSNKFRGLAREACLRLTLFLWAAVGYAVVPQVFNVTDMERKDPNRAGVVKAVDDWVATLHKAFMFLMIAFAIILVQGILLMLIKIQYIEGFIGPRAEKAAFDLEVMKDLNNLVKSHVSSDDISVVARIFKKLLLPINSKDHYYLIARGEGNQQIWDDYAAKIWQTIAKGKPHLTLSDVTSQLRAMNRPEERGIELYRQLDHSGDGVVTEDELTELVGRVGLQLNRRTQAMNGIRRLMQKLEIVLSVLVLGLIVFLYGKFFSNIVEDFLISEQSNSSKKSLQRISETFGLVSLVLHLPFPEPFQNSSTHVSFVCEYILSIFVFLLT